jgi:ubiquinone/menaquinone biosynthesis C-methylase UbiE
MSFYERRLLPHLIDRTMRLPRLEPYRRRAVAVARGRVLEIGSGSGVNFPFYPTPTRQLVALEPSARLLDMSRHATRSDLSVEFLAASAEALPLDDSSIDTVLTTWTLCSIPDVERALGELRRVLKRDGRLVFVEHGRAPDTRVARWQDRLTPIWKRLAGGCHLNRPIEQLVVRAGFDIERLDTGYMDGPRAMTFMYEGSARPR